MIGSMKVNEYIRDIENGQSTQGVGGSIIGDGSKVTTQDILEQHPFIPSADIKDHIKNHIQLMP